jgi:choline dehydrogenase-like flavoprotein
MRCSAAVAFLHPARGRPNLKVVTDALATRILFDGARRAGSKSSATGNFRRSMPRPRSSCPLAHTIRRNCLCFRGSTRPPISPS